MTVRTHIVEMLGTPWAAEAACIGIPPWVFAPSPGDRSDRRWAAALEEAAKSICADCPVTDECLAFALSHGERGVWGGTNEGERLVLLRDGNRPPQAP